MIDATTQPVFKGTLILPASNSADGTRYAGLVYQMTVADPNTNWVPEEESERTHQARVSCIDIEVFLGPSNPNTAVTAVSIFAAPNEHTEGNGSKLIVSAFVTNEALEDFGFDRVVLGFLKRVFCLIEKRR